MLTLDMTYCVVGQVKDCKRSLKCTSRHL